MNASITHRRVLATAASALAGLAGAAQAQDFNGDGFTDVAIGSPGEDFQGATDAGVVTIIYGAGPGVGLAPAGPMPAVRITQATFGLDVPETGDRFGASLVWGDFNGDLFDDLAIGAPGESHPTTGFANAGMVTILYGSPAGLMMLHQPLWTQDPPPGGGPLMGDPAETNDQFGWALAAGDFNADGFDDIAFGVPGENDEFRNLIDIGIVHVAYGCPIGPIVGPGIPVVWQSGFPWNEPSEAGDQFGKVLAAGDLDGDGTDDLAIGVPLEDVGPNVDAGMVCIAYGVAPHGIIPGGGLAQKWTQNSPGVPESNEPGDHFGAALAIGNFDGVLGEDLAIGVPYEDRGNPPVADIGCVNVIFSAGMGLGLNAFAPPAPQPAQLWHQNSGGITEKGDTGDRFGQALAAGDFNGDWLVDLAIGVPGEDLGGLPIVDAGAVHVIYGAPAGLGLDPWFVPAQFWHQNKTGVPDVSETGDLLGSALTVGDFDVNGSFDLVIGVPGEGFGPRAGAGAVMAIYGGAGAGLNALAPVASQRIHQSTPGVPDFNEAGDAFGGVLDNDD